MANAMPHVGTEDHTRSHASNEPETPLLPITVSSLQNHTQSPKDEPEPAFPPTMVSSLQNHARALKDEPGSHLSP